jgi:signal transduction histidine kinase
VIRFRSYRSKLQIAFVALALAAITVTGWEASAGAAAALRQATYDRLTAIRETRCRQIERYFEDVRNHVLALSSDESTISALEGFRAAWNTLPPVEPGGAKHRSLREHYETQVAPRMAAEPGGSLFINQWFPEDARVRGLQHAFLAANPHPVGSKDLLLAAPETGRYSDVHARYHPTLHRYQSAFGFYDIFLIEAQEARIVYTVFKEIDLGARLRAEPYRSTTLARAFHRAMALEEPEKAVLEDYAPYVASYFSPAAFLAAPIWRAGSKIGVLAIQVSVDEVNRVMTGERQWREEGLGETGQSYIVGPDGTLRSGLRFEIERPEEFYARLEGAGFSAEAAERIRRHGTVILNFPVSEEVAARLRTAARGTEMAAGLHGARVLRSHAPLAVPGLDWVLLAEIDAEEALAPVRALQWRILRTGVFVAGGFFIAAWVLAGSVTGPVLALARSAQKLGGRDFGVRMPVESEDEIGQLAASFNRMAESLERTTVSKEELEALAGRLITAQEEERSRIARELHDDLTQRLAAVAIEAGRLERLPSGGQERWRAGLEQIKQQMAQLANDIHGLSRRLHPAMLDDLGLVAAIESECRNFFERGGPPVDFRHEGSFEAVPRETQLAIFRIVQEGLRNIQRHAGAEEAAIRLRRTNTSVELEICDNGRGFDRAAPAWRAGLGLASMEERARLLGGSWALRSRPGEGVRLQVSLPAGDTHEQAQNSAG